MVYGGVWCWVWWLVIFFFIVNVDGYEMKVYFFFFSWVKREVFILFLDWVDIIIGFFELVFLEYMFYYLLVVFMLLFIVKFLNLLWDCWIERKLIFLFMFLWKGDVCYWLVSWWCFGVVWYLVGWNFRYF